jgi:hypothetical protein
MGLDTNFNQDPYFDDFDESKDFHRILFKPGVAVQARELTQLQTILQTQIERFGDNILKEGTIVKGCAFGYIERQPYVKIADLQQDGQPVVMSNYEGLRAVGLTSGVEGYVVKTSTGLESQAPDLNTLHIRYVKGSGANTAFSTTEYIRLENYRTAATVGTVQAAGNVTGVASAAIGNGTALRVSEGIIYQKGAFINVDKQLVIVDAYSVTPDAKSAGFVVAETTINSFNDTSLLDNAAGFNNANAPGADRIQLRPVLTVKTTALANADEDFFTLVEYRNGRPVRRKETTQYSVIGEEFARRTAEESGNYFIKNFPLSIEANANTSLLDARVGAGLAYVEGRRIETFGPVDITIDAGTATNSVDDQNVTTNLGNYIIVNDFKGNIPFNEFATVKLYDAAQNANSSSRDITQLSANGNLIGTAKVRSVEHHEGAVGTETTKYKVYLFDINVSNTSHSFANTRSIFYDTAAGLDAAADIVVERGRAVLKDESFKTAVWDIGVPAIKTVDTADFVYRTVTSGNEIAASDTTLSITLPGSGSQTWTYGASATLNTEQKREIILVANNTSGSNYIEGQHINLDSVVVTTSADAITLNFASLPAADSGAAVKVLASHNVKRSTTSGKGIGKDIDTYYVEVLANTAPDGVGGTYSLGLPDVYDIQAAYYNASGAANTASTDVTTYFRLNTNQRDAYYGISYVRKNNLLAVATDGGFLFKIRAFKQNTGAGVGFFSVDSYGTSYADLAPEDIPVYTSERGIAYDLRNTLDFRPYAANTVAYSTTEADAPTVTTSITAAPTFASGEKYIPAPNQNTEIDYSYYLPRIDKLFIDGQGNFQVIRGVSQESPTAPQDPSNALILATIKVPPFPSLTSLAANRKRKPAHATKMTLESIPRGYTMNDIGKLDRRIKQLEYYTVLNNLEIEAKDKSILDASGNDRFKNGIFSDTFADLSLSAVKNPDFAASVDPAYKEMQPSLKQYDMPLKVSVVSNATEYDEGTLISMTDTVLIEQPYATGGRDVSEDELNYVGNMILYPTYDNGYDTTLTPDYNLDLDMEDSFADFSDNIQKFMSLQSVNKKVAGKTTTVFAKIPVYDWPQGDVHHYKLETKTVSTASITKNLQIGRESETDVGVGDYVKDVRFTPFMRSRELSVFVSGVRPLTKLYFFFDGQSVDTNIAPAVSSVSASPNSLKNFKRTRAYGTEVISDARGRARVIFRIPPETFFVGSRRLEVLDVSSRATAKASAGTGAYAIYNAFNYKESELGTRPIVIDDRIYTSTTHVTRSFATYEEESGESGPGSDNSSDGDGDGDGSGDGDGKIICTAMNNMYGFGSYRNAIWMKYQKDYMSSEEYQLGYHKLIMPLVKKMPTNKTIRVILERIAKQRTIYLRKEMRGEKQIAVMISKFTIRPLFFAVGWLVKKKILSKKEV